MEEEGAGLKMWGLLSFWNVELCHRLMIFCISRLSQNVACYMALYFIYGMC